jgi:hypothetical protein
MKLHAAPAFGLAGLASVALLGVACGGGSQNKTSAVTPAALSASEVLRAAESFVQAEGAQAQPGYYPTTLRADGTPEPTTPASTCPARTVDHPSPTSTRITLEFTGCPQGPAGSVMGKLILTLSSNPPGWTASYDAFSAISGTQMWQIDGTKGVSLNTAAQGATIQVQNLSVRYADSAHPENNRAFAYSASLTGSWATAGTYRVWGTYTLSVPGEAPVTATIAQGEALVYAPGCCYPTAGTIRFAKGAASGSATFLSTCGSVKVESAAGTETRTLEACR